MIRTLLILLVLTAVAQGAVIDVGPGATDRASTIAATYTIIDFGNRANATGTLDTVEIYAATDLTGCKVGTFYRTTGNTFQCRDSEAIGNVTSGSKQTFTSLSISATEGDYLGIYFATGTLERDSTGQVGMMYVSGEYADAGDSTAYALLADDAVSIYATGTASGSVAGTFGCTTIGGSASTMGANAIRGSSGTPASNGQASRITLYTPSGWAEGEKIRCALYDASDGSFVAETGELSAAAVGWVDFTFASPVAVSSATDYLIAFWFDTGTVITYGAVVGDAFPTDDTGTYPTWPDPVGDNTGYQYTVYATYTPTTVPDAASNPTPADAATEQLITVDLSWDAATGATSYDVYFGTDSTPDATELIGNQAGTTYNPTLAYDTIYWWRIDTVNASGTTTGPVWVFTTESEGGGEGAGDSLFGGGVVE